MATALRRGPRQDGEVGRLRVLVEEQHRRLRLLQAETERPEDAGDVIEPLPCRCDKPRVSSAGLARLIAEAEARLALSESAVGRALEARWPEPRPAIPVLRPTPGLPAYAQAAEGPTPNLVFALFGRDPAGQRQAVERVLREQRGTQPFVPVFLTNHPDFSVLTQARLVFEYFPFLLDETVAGPPAAWAACLIDLLQLTCRRWGVQRLVQI